MSEESSSPDHAHSHPNYVKIYLILLGLLVVSIIGPMLGNIHVLLITAFGVAVVKAVMVGSYFMHLNVEKKYIWFLLIIGVLFLAVLFIGVAPDVMKKDGLNWTHSGDAPPAVSAPAHH